MGTAKSGARGHASERDQFWLDHESAQAASGQTAKDYAAAQNLSLHAFYQARKRLRALGLLATPDRGAPSRKVLRKKALSFSKLTVASRLADARFRVELPGGAALEWSGGEVPEPVIALLERLAQRA